MPLLDSLNELILSAAGSPWVYPAVLVLVVIDGFFPPIPSESAIVALGALAVSSGTPNLILLVAVAAVGAAAGDLVAYLIGRQLGVARFAWMRRAPVVAAIGRAQAALDRRAAVLLLTARFIPVGRVAVNMTAGATRFPLRRFLPLAALAGTCWALYTTLIGVLAGAWMRANPILGACLAIVLALVVGALVDAVASRVSARRRRRAEDAAAVSADAERAELALGSTEYELAQR